MRVSNSPFVLQLLFLSVFFCCQRIVQREDIASFCWGGIDKSKAVRTF